MVSKGLSQVFEKDWPAKKDAVNKKHKPEYACSKFFYNRGLLTRFAYFH